MAALLTRILDTIAPSIALRRRMQVDDWTKQMVLQLHMSFIDDEHSKHTTTSDFLQQQAEPLKQEMMRVLLKKITAVSDSTDRKAACRRWVLEEAKAYAPVRAIFVAADDYADEVRSGARHALNHGLWNDVDAIITHSLKPLLEQYGTVEGVKTFLRRESMWLHARLEFANTGRLLLDDTELIDEEDWVRLLMKLLVTQSELDYLTFLGVPEPEGAKQLRSEVARVEALATRAA